MFYYVFDYLLHQVVDYKLLRNKVSENDEQTDSIRRNLTLAYSIQPQ